MHASVPLRRLVLCAAFFFGALAVCHGNAAEGAVDEPSAAPDAKLARLGITFDPSVRAAALAAEQNASRGLSESPADPNVIRLPRYTITDERVTVEERQLLTPKGRRDLALKRYINPAYGKTLGPVMAVASFLNNPLGGWAPNTPEAMTLYWDDEFKAQKARMNELTDIAALSERLKEAKPSTPTSRKPGNPE